MENKPFEGASKAGGFYDTKLWKSIRNKHIQLEPLCRHCKAKGILIEVRIVDHIIPIEKGGSKTDDNNLQSLCITCNAKKTQNDRK